jgi:P22 coat protein - gene protein 5
MAITNFIPELWAASMLELWVAQNVFPSLVNREYEGLATKGNTVKITGVVIPTVQDYAANNRTTTPEAISDTGVDLLIDQAKSTDFYVDDIDRTQAAGSLTPFTDAAAYAMVADCDEFIANLLVEGGQTLSGTIPLTGDDAYNLFVSGRKQLNVNNVPPDNRVVVCNAEFESLLLQADAKFVKFFETGDHPNAGLRNATIGQVLGMRVVTSNHLPAQDTPQFLMFNMRAAAFVSQLDQVEAMRDQLRFADRVRALHVYGGTVVRPEGVLVFNPNGS